MSLVALSASYGAGGSVIGPALAERLDVPFIDRAIPLAVADRLHVPYDDAAAHDEQVSTGWLQRVLSGFVGADSGAPAPLAPEMFSSDDFRRATEEVLLQQAATGDGVILGRGSVVVLREDPRALRVRLDGPAARRVEQAMRLDAALDREGAERALRQFDRTHAAYLQQLYGVDIRDSTLYHLALDSTCIDLDACVEIIARAARALEADARAGGTNGTRGRR
ncbi:MAG TPA: cytidylate kinase-like family protein [Solirubrobacteraceae bacterium]|nr:cytidylate kinase-like family protein [Solirubrobacteraceae bacterium]